MEAQSLCGKYRSVIEFPMQVLEKACSALKNCPEAWNELQACRLKMAIVLLCMARDEQAPPLQRAIQVQDMCHHPTPGTPLEDRALL